jgi:predicted lipid-binding transport protein (Tim44 family)
MTNPTEAVNARDSDARREELELERIRLFIDFAKFGFTGTLSGGIVGILLVFGLACLGAFTKFDITGWSLVGMSLIILIGVVAFGYFSLWEFPKIAAHIQQMQIEVDAAKKDGILRRPSG